jgi:hypothetical protein
MLISRNYLIKRESILDYFTAVIFTNCLTRQEEISETFMQDILHVYGFSSESESHESYHPLHNYAGSYQEFTVYTTSLTISYYDP